MGATMMNFYPLGSKGTSTDPKMQLGSKHIFKDETVSVADATASLNSGREIVALWVKNNSGTALSASTLVVWDTADVGKNVGIVTGAAGVGAGVVDPYLKTTVADGEFFYLVIEGIVPVTSGAAYSAGALLIPAATGRAITMTADVAGLTSRFGRAVEAASGAGQLKRALVSFQP